MLITKHIILFLQYWCRKNTKVKISLPDFYFLNLDKRH